MDAPSNEDPVSPQLDFYYFLRPLIIPLRRCSEILLAPKPELVPQDGILVSELAHFHEGIMKHANRDARFASDPLVKKFLTSVGRIVGYLQQDFIPDQWNEWHTADTGEPGFSLLDVFPYCPGDDLLEQSDPYHLPATSRTYDPNPEVDPEYQPSSAAVPSRIRVTVPTRLVEALASIDVKALSAVEEDLPGDSLADMVVSAVSSSTSPPLVEALAKMNANAMDGVNLGVYLLGLGG